MKIDKKKVVFISIIMIVLLFIMSYTMLIFMEEEVPEKLHIPSVPELKEEQEEYSSKIDALDAIKEERERSIPSVYSENYLDSLDAYAPAIEDDREWMVDSIIRLGIVEPEQKAGYEEENNREEPSGTDELTMGPVVPIEDLSAGHAAFFLSSVSSEILPKQIKDTRQKIRAEVNGTQTLRSGDRLELILVEEADIDGTIFPKNTTLYGFASLQLNRVHIRITHIKNREAELKAYDLQDSNEGIYVKNSFSAEAGREVLDDVVQGINIAGLPQIGGIKNIFRKNNRNMKVTILDQYQLILKAEK